MFTVLARTEKSPAGERPRGPRGAMQQTLDRYFLLRRLHSLTGIVPVGGYLVFHLFANFTSVQGPEAYDRLIETIARTPFLLALEFGLIYIPLLFHSIYGFLISREPKMNVG